MVITDKSDYIQKLENMIQEEINSIVIEKDFQPLENEQEDYLTTLNHCSPTHL